ncbi:MAG: glycosidase [Promethearchaeota archaeon]
MIKNLNKELFIRHKNNPIITALDLPYPANTVFNAGAVKKKDTFLLLMRVEDKRGISHLTLARSKNGIDNWLIDPSPALVPNPEQYPEEIWGIEDPRITFLEEKKEWAITYTSYSTAGPLVSLATTSDFKEYNRFGPIMPPENKDAALFSIRFNGLWALIHRPVCNRPGMGAHIWISYSPDLIHWGEHQILIPARRGSWWDANKIGISPPPIKTEEGWLILYHGVKETVGGIIYRLGLALLDLKNPRNLIARSDEWVFSPSESYEIIGDVDKVVFPCGWILDKSDIFLYYGSADKCIALAKANLLELLEWLKKYKLK